ncbi:response regulator [Desulfonatronospira thiodismutans]|uniref:response regulator n=1 Tax=Desulfonatronospira thiodismutans TaxID=488939 RepID=UPI00019757C3|nr:response regulator [Desulfonatronospira thiodismutans]
MKLLLEKCGHKVSLAEDGQQALDLFASLDFDCILMDIHMSVMDGVEAIPESQTPRIPIIALTAYAMDGDRERFLDAGMDDYLAKPVQKEDLEKALARYAERGLMSF